MRHSGPLFAITALALLTATSNPVAQIHWQIDAASVCSLGHSYRFYQRYSSTFSPGVAGPNDAIEINEAAFNPQTGKAKSKSVWKKPDGTIWKQALVAATCAADPWLFSKAVAHCSNFQLSTSCPNPQDCQGADQSAKFRVPAGVVTEKPLSASQIPLLTITSPKAEQTYMVLEVPVNVSAPLPASNPFCAVAILDATRGGDGVSASLPLKAGSANDTLSFVGKPTGHWTLTARIRQYTGKATTWTNGPSESMTFYVGPAWPGGNQKPVSVTMLQIVLPTAGASIPSTGSSLVIRVHRDLLSVANHASVNWKYGGTGGGLGGEPWPGSTPLPGTVALPVLSLRGDPDWRQYSAPLDFGSLAVKKQWTVKVCVRAYDTDLCQQRTFALAGP